MKTKIAIVACAALLGGCASYSDTHRQIAYGGSGYYDESTGSDDSAYYGDVDYDDNAYYDEYSYSDGYAGGFSGGGFYGGGYGGSFFGYGGSYGYCPPHDAFCARDPLAVFLFPIGGGRYWLMFDGYHDWRGYGGGYGYGGYGYGYGGYGYGYGWGFPHGDRDHDHGDHHHHHHHDGDPPDPVTQTPPPVATPPARLFLTSRPRKGVYTPNSMPRPQQPAFQVGDENRTPRERRDEDSGVAPPMRWRTPGTVAAPSTDTGAPGRGRSRSDVPDRPQPSAPPERPRVRDSDPPSRPESSPDRQPSSPRDNEDEGAVRNRRHGDAGGGR